MSTINLESLSNERIKYPRFPFEISSDKAKIDLVPGKKQSCIPANNFDMSYLESEEYLNMMKKTESFQDQIMQAQLDLVEKVMKQVLAQHLGREVNLEDAKRCQRYEREDIHDRFIFAYDNVPLGTIIYGYPDPSSYSMIWKNKTTLECMSEYTVKFNPDLITF